MSGRITHTHIYLLIYHIYLFDCCLRPYPRIFHLYDGGEIAVAENRVDLGKSQHEMGLKLMATRLVRGYWDILRLQWCASPLSLMETLYHHTPPTHKQMCVKNQLLFGDIKQTLKTSYNWGRSDVATSLSYLLKTTPLGYQLPSTIP